MLYASMAASEKRDDSLKDRKYLPKYTPRAAKTMAKLSNSKAPVVSASSHSEVEHEAVVCCSM